MPYFVDVSLLCLAYLQQELPAEEAERLAAHIALTVGNCPDEYREARRLSGPGGEPLPLFRVRYAFQSSQRGLLAFDFTIRDQNAEMGVLEVAYVQLAEGDE